MRTRIVYSMLMIFILSLNLYYASLIPNLFAYQNSEVIVKENLKIIQIYNETVFVSNLTVRDNKPIFTVINDEFNNLKNFELVIFNINLTERTLKWFIGELNPIRNLPFLLEKGFLFTFKLKEENKEQHFINKLSDKFKTKFVKIDSNFYVTGGNFGVYLDDFLLSLNYTYKGFYLLNEHLKPVGIIYKVDNDVQQLILLYFTTLATSPDIYTKRLFSINYTRFLSNITSSEFSTNSTLEFYFYGMIVHESKPTLSWFSSYENNWVTYSNYRLNKNEAIGKISVNSSKIDPFILVTQSANPGVFNSTTKLYISIYNYGTVEANNITVKVKLPEGINSNNNTLIFNKVSPNSYSKKYIEISVSLNESKIIDIPPPEVYYKVGNTVIKNIGNPLRIGYKVKNFPVLSYILFPNKVAGELTDILDSLTEFRITVNNTGDAEAKDVKLILDYLSQPIGDIKPNSSDFIIFGIEPNKLKFVPPGSASIFNVTITYRYDNKTEKLENIYPYFYTFSSAFSYVNYLSLSQKKLPNVILPTKIQLAWSSIALGAPRSAILNSTVSDLEKLGLIYTGPDSFSKRGNKIEVKYSFLRGEKHTVSLAMNFSSYSHYIVAPFYQYVEPLKIKFLVPPLVFSSAIVIKKEVNNTVIGVGSYLDVTVTLTNLSNETIYNVELYDEITTGWKYISGLNRTFAPILSPKTNLTLKYVIEASSPEFNNLPSANANYYFFGEFWNSKSNPVDLLIKLIIKFNIFDWNMNKLNNATLIIKDTKGKILGNFTIKDGLIEWEGFIGSINVDIIFKNNVVARKSYYLTPKNTSLNIKTYVFNLNLTIKDIFGLNLKDIKVYLQSSNLTMYPNIKDGYFFFEGIPKGLYSLNIEISNNDYKIPIIIDERFSQNINIGLPIIKIGNIILDLQLIIGLILLTFLIFFIYIILRLKRK
jgi:uncharacterized repeat protein (TIGR01451 family)